ncbi:MAG: antitoxin family protein [Oscillospiraceae bacterium]|nr:antitoxin family protein [Oscillospiraceae bacterium]
MNTVRAIYDGAVFVPMETPEIKKGQRVRLAISADEEALDRTSEKLAAFEMIVENLRRINKIEPMPQEFDEMISVGVDFSTEVEL